MTHTHQADGGLILLVAIAYEVLATVGRRPWPWWRTAFFLTGCLALAAGRLMRHRLVHAVAHPVVALTLNLGGLAVLFLTPLYAATTRDPTLHLLVHVHFPIAGYLFAWVIAGPDPAPRRPSVPYRLAVLGVAIAFHSILSQLLYAGVLDLPVPVAERQGGAELMYHGGDIAELLLAGALLAGRRRLPDRTRGRLHRDPYATDLPGCA
ncbi:cytochrome c oxidase assembly protein [Paractinoplanes atraurantiacus]|uniref:Putative membrane protein n=1 Tax=Paractinoplanes atraurantiacus TaxID=1036182 RepID=A0A285ICJ4_9ACTN|nr:cytochrome c oxidase assembly protein [Actinoplanes atraurantiacus]SNY45695.1 putative membrane protein [Actinoplanes atraurantiacus]